MREPLLVDKDENIARAFELLERKKDTHIIVTDEGRVVGILSVKDLLRTVLDRMRWGYQRVGKLYVSAIMTPNPIYLPSNTKIVDIARVMIEKGISSVIIGDNLENIEKVGIITKRDLLQNWTRIFPQKLRARDVMTENPIVIHPGTSIKHAEWILREKRISTLPVIEEGNLVGYLDARILALSIVKTYLKGDIKHFDIYLQETTVSDVMKAPHYVEEESPIEDVAKLLLRKKAKGTPVLLDDRLTGILTETDFARLIAEKQI